MTVNVRLLYDGNIYPLFSATFRYFVSFVLNLTNHIHSKLPWGGGGVGWVVLFFEEDFM